jgi:hypothetical protein
MANIYVTSTITVGSGATGQTYDGSGDTYIRADASNGHTDFDGVLMVFAGTNNIFQNYKWDDYSPHRTYATNQAVSITGQGCEVRYCTLINSQRYGLTCTGTTGTWIHHNTFRPGSAALGEPEGGVSAQYCISGTTGDMNYDGIVEYYEWND